MSAGDAVLLFGGTGYTGRLIAKRLDALGIPFTIAAREASSAREVQAELTRSVPIVPVDVLDSSRVRRALQGARVVISCVGPYALYGELLLEECRKREIIYLDLTGEQEFVRRSFEAGRRGSQPGTILHSVAFESTLADLLAAELYRPGTAYRSVSSFYSFVRSRPSPGTLLTMKLTAHFPTYRVAGGVLRGAEPLSLEATEDPPEDGASALLMPYPEVLFFRERFRPLEAASYLLLPKEEAALARAARGRATPPLETIVAQHRRVRRTGPSQPEREQQRFTLTVAAVKRDGARSTRRLVGRDMYGITAVLVCRVVEAAIAGASFPRGTLLPGEAPAWDGIWKLLEDEQLAAAPVETLP